MSVTSRHFLFSNVLWTSQKLKLLLIHCSFRGGLLLWEILRRRQEWVWSSYSWILTSQNSALQGDGATANPDKNRFLFKFAAISTPIRQTADNNCHTTFHELLGSVSAHQGHQSSTVTNTALSPMSWRRVNWVKIERERVKRAFERVCFYSSVFANVNLVFVSFCYAYFLSIFITWKLHFLCYIFLVFDLSVELPPSQKCANAYTKFNPASSGCIHTKSQVNSRGWHKNDATALMLHICTTSAYPSTFLESCQNTVENVCFSLTFRIVIVGFLLKKMLFWLNM